MNKNKSLMLTILAALSVSACSHNVAPSKNTLPSSSTPQSNPAAPMPAAPELQHGTPVAEPKPLVALPLVAARYQPAVVQRQTTHHFQQPHHHVVRPAAYQHPAAAHTLPPAVQPLHHRPQAAVLRPNQHRAATPQQSILPRLSKRELEAIGNQIFKNEGGGNVERLVHWNVGEDFAAMGIGHFTWYPSNRRQRFGNTFPGLLDYLAQNGVQLPPWLQRARHEGAPWRSRTELLRSRNSRKVRELTDILNRTKGLQAQYIVNRAHRAMPKLIKSSAGHMQQHVARNLTAVANTPGGWYALIDYVNFKGEGLSNRGGYKGQSWGLRQVLENMRPSRPGQQALNEFSNAAYRVLKRRVQNSDPKRNEARWLRGWKNRVDTYRYPIV